MIRHEEIARAVRDCEYAVRGPIVARAQELERQGRRIIYCNIGNPQSLGQRPVTWVRQILALAEYPELADKVPGGTFPADVVETARLIARETKHGLGAYTESKGYRFVREAVARFISERDGIAADPDAIFLTDGASKGVQAALRILIADGQDGILIPIPQYPLYSATITLYGGAAIGYHLDEANVEMVLRFAAENGLAVLADEVYQDNVWREGDRFVSFAKVLERLSLKDVSLFSFHSVSKGYLGECGHRGGYLECRNVPGPVQDEITKLQSIALCANSVGQIVTYLLVSPPRPGSPSYPLYERERREILDALRRKAAIVGKGLDAVEGIRCNEVTGAMYAFPRIELPPGTTDFEYCLALLEETGICVVDGTGFGQLPGTAHFRTTILPPLDEIETVVRRIADFHRAFVKRRAQK